MGGALSWGALLHFVQHVPRSSALSREIEPQSDTERWVDGDMSASILADIFDAITAGFAGMAAKGTGRSAKRMKPYPRPWLKPKVRKVGRGGIPVRDFERWWNDGG